MEARLYSADGSHATVSVPANLELPTNLVVTGTVNVDETTYGFSPKVLDRAPQASRDCRKASEELSAGSPRQAPAANRDPRDRPAAFYCRY
jgi:hypothetical protein